MGVRVTCPACEASFGVGENMRGKRVPCRECRKSVPVPAEDELDDVEEIDEVDEVDEVEELDDEDVEAPPQSKSRSKSRDDDERRPQKKSRSDDDEDSRVKKGPPPIKKPARAEYDEDEKEQTKSRTKKGPPPIKKTARAGDDEDEDGDDADEADRPAKKKQGASPLIWVAGGGAVLVGLLAGLFVLMRPGPDRATGLPPENQSKEIAEAKPPTSDKSGEPKKGLGGDPDPTAKKDPPAKDPDPTDEPTEDPEPKKGPKTKKDPAPKKDPKPPIVAVSNDPPPDPGPTPTALSSEKVYQRLLKSSVWVLAPQPKAIVLKPPPPPSTGGNPSDPKNPMVDPKGPMPKGPFPPMRPMGPMPPLPMPKDPKEQPKGPPTMPPVIMPPAMPPTMPPIMPPTQPPLPPKGGPGKDGPMPMPMPMPPVDHRGGPAKEPPPPPATKDPPPGLPGGPTKGQPPPPATKDPPGLPPNPMNPMKEGPPKEGAKEPGAGASSASLVGTTWSGKDSLQGATELKFHFLSQDRVLLFDRDDVQPGSYRQANGAVSLTFFGGALTYSGSIAEDSMGGNSRRGRDSGKWDVTRRDSPGFGSAEPAVQLTVKGTGILVDRKQRLILTNGHVVGDARTIELHFPKEENGGLVVQRDAYKRSSGIRGKVVVREERCDLALVQLDSLPAGVEVMPLASTSARPAQSVHSLGNPALGRTLWKYGFGRIRQVSRDNWKLFDDFAGQLSSFEGMKIETDSPVYPGDSGGPLVNERGVLVGIANGSNLEEDSNTSSYIDVSEARTLLKRYYQSIGEKWVPEPEPVSQENLARIPALILRMQRDDFNIRLNAVQTLGSLGAEASLAFQPMFALRKTSEDPVIRNAIDEALEKIPPRPGDLDALTEVARNTSLSTTVRQQSLRSIGRLGANARAATPTLYELVKDADLELQRMALSTIAAVGPDSKDIPHLTPALKSSHLPVVCQAVDALGRIGPDARPVVPQLVMLLKKTNRGLKEKVLESLEKIGPAAATEAGPYLHDLLKEADQDLGGRVAVTMVRLGETKTSIPYLIHKMETGKMPQRLKTVRLMAQLGPEARVATSSLLSLLDEEALHEDAKAALIAIGKVATKTTSVRMTQSKNAKTRLACINILGEIRYNHPDVVAALQLIAVRDPMPENQAAAVKTLSRITGF